MAKRQFTSARRAYVDRRHLNSHLALHVHLTDTVCPVAYTLITSKEYLNVRVGLVREIRRQNSRDLSQTSASERSSLVVDVLFRAALVEHRIVRFVHREDQTVRLMVVKIFTDTR